MIADGYGLSEAEDSDVVTDGLAMSEDARKEMQRNLENTGNMNFGSNGSGASRQTG